MTPVLLLTMIFCRAGRLYWFLEVVPALVGYVALAATYRRFRFTDFVYVCVFLHTLILVYGGCSTYAATPALYGNWARDTFHLARNHYDRVGHLALGFFPVIIVRETLLRVTPLRRGGWLTFIVLSVVLAIGAFYELASSGGRPTSSPPTSARPSWAGKAIPWDTQWDMFFDLAGGVLGPAALAARPRSGDGPAAGRLITRVIGSSRAGVGLGAPAGAGWLCHLRDARVAGATGWRLFRGMGDWLRNELVHALWHQLQVVDGRDRFPGRISVSSPASRCRSSVGERSRDTERHRPQRPSRTVFAQAHRTRSCGPPRIQARRLQDNALTASIRATQELRDPNASDAALARPPP